MVTLISVLTLSIECPSPIFFFLACALCFGSFLFVVFVLFLFLFCFHDRWSCVDVPLICFLSSRPRTGLATTYIFKRKI